MLKSFYLFSNNISCMFNFNTYLSEVSLFIFKSVFLFPNGKKLLEKDID